MKSIFLILFLFNCVKSKISLKGKPLQTSAELVAKRAALKDLGIKRSYHHLSEEYTVAIVNSCLETTRYIRREGQDELDEEFNRDFDFPCWNVVVLKWLKTEFRYLFVDSIPLTDKGEVADTWSPVFCEPYYVTNQDDKVIESAIRFSLHNSRILHKEIDQEGLADQLKNHFQLEEDPNINILKEGNEDILKIEMLSNIANLEFDIHLYLQNNLSDSLVIPVNFAYDNRNKSENMHFRIGSQKIGENQFKYTTTCSLRKSLERIRKAFSEQSIRDKIEHFFDDKEIHFIEQPSISISIDDIEIKGEINGNSCNEDTAKKLEKKLMELYKDIMPKSVCVDIIGDYIDIIICLEPISNSVDALNRRLKYAKCPLLLNNDIGKRERNIYKMPVSWTDWVKSFFVRTAELELDCELNKFDWYNATFLSIRSNIDICLVKESRNFDTSNNELINLIKEGNIDKIMNYLSNNIANIDEILNQLDNHGETPIICAIQLQQLEVIEQLLRCGANASLLDKDQWSPLMHASYVGNLEIVEKLIRASSNIHYINDDRLTALILAKNKKHSNVVERLISVGAIESDEVIDIEDIVNRKFGQAMNGIKDENRQTRKIELGNQLLLEVSLNFDPDPNFGNVAIFRGPVRGTHFLSNILY